MRDQLILKLNTLLGGTPAILPGAECWYSAEMLDLVEQDDSPFTRLNRSRYLLLELAPGPLPRRIEALLHELSVQEIVPVIAHPERNPIFAKTPELLGMLVERGAVTQVTAGSLVGDFGRWVRDAAEELFRRGLVHMVASDAHSVDQRPPRLQAARERVRRTWGTEAEMGLFDANPSAVVRSEPLAWLPA